MGNNRALCLPPPNPLQHKASAPCGAYTILHYELKLTGVKEGSIE